MSNEHVMEFSFGEDDRKARPTADRFKGEKDMKYRLSFAWWKEVDENGIPVFDSKPKFVGQKIHYVQGKGYFMNPDPTSKEGKQIAKLCGNKPKFRGATIMIKWPTNRAGKPRMDELKEGMFDVLPWVFDPRKYEQFMGIHDETPFGEFDILVTCTNSDFQHMTFQAVKGNLLKKVLTESTKFNERILEEIAERATTIGDELGSYKTPSELRGILSGAANHDVNAVAEAEIEDVDGILDDELDLDDD